MAHIHDRIDFTAEVFVVFENKVLLRMHDKYGIWLSVGGHIELDEDPNQAAIREVKEEVGLDIELYDTRKYKENSETFKELVAPVFLNRHRINDHHEHITLGYFGKSSSDNFTNDSSEIAEDLRWFTVDDLNSEQYDIRDSVKFYAEMAIVELSE